MNSDIVAYSTLVLSSIVAVSAVMILVNLREIHRLVNSRLSEALAKIERLERALGLAPGQEPPVGG